MPDDFFFDDADDEMEVEDPGDEFDDPIETLHFIGFSDLFDGDCPRCGNAGCRHCRDRRDAAEYFGHPIAGQAHRRHRREAEDDHALDYGDRLSHGFSLLAESDESVLDE